MPAPKPASPCEHSKGEMWVKDNGYARMPNAISKRQLVDTARPCPFCQPAPLKPAESCELQEFERYDLLAEEIEKIISAMIKRMKWNKIPNEMALYSEEMAEDISIQLRKGFLKGRILYDR